MARTKAETAYLLVYTRWVMAHEWAPVQIRGGSLNLDGDTDPVVACAIDQGWISKEKPHRILAVGFQKALTLLK